MRKLLVWIFLSLAIAARASDTYVYPPGLDSAIQHWQYPSTAAMNADFGFYSQDIGKIAYNTGTGIYYYLADTTPTWVTLATGGGGGSTTFIGLIDVPSTYAGAAGQLVAVNGTATGLVFQAAAGGGNVSNSGTPATGETAVWVDSTHVKGVRTLGAGSTNFVLTKLSNTDYDYGWVTPGGGSTVSITATTPILVTPSPLTGTGVISLDPASDLSALEALTGTNTIYYRSGTNTWSPVTVGANLTFSAGTLAATTGGSGTNAFGTVAVSGQSNVVAASAPDTLTLVGGANITLTTSAIGKSVTINGVGSGVTSISGTSPIQVSPNPITTTGTISIESGSDLAALDGLTGTNTIYYRSGVSAWSIVNMGANMQFSAGSLSAINANWDTGYNERRQWDGGSTNLNAAIGRSSLGGTTIGSNVFTLTNPLSTSWLKITSAGAVTTEDAATTKSSLGLNTANWDTAYTDRMKWDTSLGISGGTQGQGRTALGATTAGSSLFTLVNPGATSYMKVGTTGTVTYNATIPNADLTNSSITITGDVVNLGGSITSDQIIAPSGLGYVKRTATNTYTATTTSIPNADLANDTITFAASSVALGGTVTADNAIGLAAGIGLMKRSGASNYTIAVAGTDYKAAATATVIVKQFTTTQTYTVPAAVNALYVECVGGGGGGGGFNMTSSVDSVGMPGGGGGGYAAVYIASPATSYSITIGAGGAGGSAGAGGTGGTTTVGATSVCTATGGAGGAGSGGAGSSPAVWLGTSPANSVGGVGTVGTTKISGSDGQAGFSMSPTNAIGGSGGGTYLAGMTVGAHTTAGTAVAGNAGSAYGGGGSGCILASVVASRTGGAGAAGVVRIWEIY